MMEACPRIVVGGESQKWFNSEYYENRYTWFANESDMACGEKRPVKGDIQIFILIS